MKTRTIELVVLKIAEDEVYKDFVRIPEKHRGEIPEGRVCALRVGQLSIRRSVRGWLRDDAPNIRMDEYTRKRLQVEAGKPAKFSITECSWIGQFLWAWNASDPVSRMAARLGILSFVLGIIGLILGIVSLWK